MREILDQGGSVIVVAEPRDYQKWDAVGLARACEWRGPKPVPASHKAADSYLGRVQAAFPNARRYQGGKLEPGQRFVCPHCLAGVTYPESRCPNTNMKCNHCGKLSSQEALRQYFNACVVEVK